MKKLATALALVVLIGAAVPGQSFKVVTRATPPPREALERLSLVGAWHARLPVHGQRDGIFSVQVIPGERTQLIVQTHDGLVALLDGETGDILWRTQVGIPGWVSQAAGANATSIFVTRRHELHVINRKSGYERVYTVERDTKQLNYGMALLALPSAEPVADDDAVYLALTNRVVAYALPLFEAQPRTLEAADSAKEKEGTEPGKDEAPAKPAPKKPVHVETKPIDPSRPLESSLQPKFAWSYSVGDDVIQQPPILGGNQVGAVTVGGEIISLNRFAGKQRQDFRIAAHVSRPAGHHGPVAYIGGDDTYVYAINLENGSLLWRDLAGAIPAHRPVVTDRDVFIAPAREGMIRLDRATGRELWRNRQAERFLSVNQRFVYAADTRGHLHVLDGLRGTTLARHDLQDWTIAVPNEVSDRIYLASREGQILCLRHRDQLAPLAMKKPEVRKKPAAKEPAEDKAAEEKKADDKKEEKKDEDKKEEKGARRASPERTIELTLRDPQSSGAPTEPRLSASRRRDRLWTVGAGSCHDGRGS